MATFTKIREDLVLVQHRLWGGPEGFGFAHGATLGQEHCQRLVEQLELNAIRGRGQPSAVVILDFFGIESASASYVKATLVTLAQAGERASREGTEPAADTDTLPTLPIYPMIAGLAPDLSNEIDVVLRDTRCACFEVLACTATGVARAVVRGPVEDGLRWTLELLARERIVTATELHERFSYDRTGPARPVTVTAWNNRLAELNRLRLAHRTRQGRQWLYHSLVGEIVHG